MVKNTTIVPILYKIHLAQHNLEKFISHIAIVPAKLQHNLFKCGEVSLIVVVVSKYRNM
jgi:hypothetical protein